MAKKEFTFRGFSVEEVRSMGLSKFMNLVPSRERRKIQKGFTQQEKRLLVALKKAPRVKTHCRDMVIIPEMLDKTIMIHTGKEYVQVLITPEMLGHRLGEFALSRKNVTHGAMGVGATKSSGAVSVK